MAISNETSERILCTLKEEFIERVIPSHMVDCLGDFLDQRDEEEVRAKAREYGDTRGAEHLWTLLCRKPNWFEQVVTALYHKHVDLPDLAEKFVRERGCLPVHVNIRAITDQQGTTVFQQSCDQESQMDQESPMDIDEEQTEFTASNIPPQAESDQFEIQQPQSHAAPEGRHNAAEDNNQMLLERFNIILQSAANAEGRQVIEDALKNLELQLIAVRNGSIILIVKPPSIEVLVNIFEMHTSGALAKTIYQKIVTTSLMQKLRKEAETFGRELRNIHLTTQIKEKEYISLKSWLTDEKEYIMAQSPMESYCLFGQSTQTLQSIRRADEEKIQKLKAVRKHLPTSVRLMVEDPCIGNDFIDNAVEVIFRSDEKRATSDHKSHLFLRPLPDKAGRQLVSEIMNWISTIYDDQLSKFDEDMQDILNTLALVIMGNICILNDDSIYIDDEPSAFKVTLEEDVKQFLKQELVHLTKRMHFDVPNMLLIGLETGSVVVRMNIEQLIIQSILYSVPLKRGFYRFVSNILRDFLIGAAICYKTLPAVQRDVKTTLLQYFHKFKYLHIPVCSPLTSQAAHTHNQVVINMYKEIEKNNPAMADEFANTLLCSLEFCNRPEAKGWLEYFGSKLKLIHSEGTFKRNGGVLKIETKQLLRSLVIYDILYKFMISGSMVNADTKALIKSKVDEFTRQRNFIFRGDGIFSAKTEIDSVAILRCIQVLDLINCSSDVELSEDGNLLCELQKKSPVLEKGISLDLSHNVLSPLLSHNLHVCLSTVHGLTSLSLVSMTNMNLQWLRAVFNRGYLSDLRIIDLSENNVFEGLDRELGLKYCPDLTHLVLSKCSLSDQALDIFCKEIKSLHKFRHLNISDNEITPSGLISLTNCLADKYTLTHVSLSGNSLGGRTVGCGLVLSTLLKGAPLLEVLELSNTGLTDNDIALILQSLPATLRVIDLGGNNLSEASHNMLTKISRPSLRIAGFDRKTELD